ncbi:uncharacterized protein LOC131593564 [Vicia villosa]|uniref:uncharacterized protein LOC131593564 n=1 Tax=Vicia villosa TaxID=3911 RepID=UPI00273CB7F4|nr:uncharacterized protein LOC131593564 [Vicia villosa]
MSERSGKPQQNRRKPYSAPAGKGKQQAAKGKRPSDGGAPYNLRCFKCCERGHQISECTIDVKKCYRCGKSGHVMADCKHKEMICFTCGEEGHISTHCQKPKQAHSDGKVFALAGSQTSSEDRLIKGTNWLEFNYVHFNCYNKSVWFLTSDEEEKVGLLTTRKLIELMQEEAQVFSLIASFSDENQAAIDKL